MTKYKKLTNSESRTILTDDDELQVAMFKNDDLNLHSSLHLDYDHARDFLQYNESISSDNAISTFNESSNSLGCTSERSRNLLIPNLDADDSTREILLQRSYSKHDNDKNGTNYECLCQQNGFASNLNNKSTRTAKSKILWAIGMCCIFMIVEFLGGYIAGSLAIMTDAAHLASDCISFVIGLVAICLGNKPPDGKMSFGYKRLEVMGAIISILSIWILTATLVFVAVQRIFSHGYELNADTMMTISGIGILINIIMFFILHTSSDDLPEGSICGGHGHSHSRSHSHNHNHYGHSHSSFLQQSSYQRKLSNDTSHSHSVPSVGLDNAAGTQEEDTGDNNSNRHDAGTSGSATPTEMLAGHSPFKENDMKFQQNGSSKNLNLRAATIHVIGDLVQSVGVFIAAAFIKIYPGAKILDPLCTILFSVIVILTTVNLFRESMYILMDAVPKTFSVTALESDLLDIEGVKSVHYLNVWNHTSGHTILMVHLIIDLLVDSNAVLLKATQLANGTKYNVKHSTIQIERVNS